MAGENVAIEVAIHTSDCCSKVHHVKRIQQSSRDSVVGLPVYVCLMFVWSLLQESALFAENAATVQRLTEEGKAKYQPLALTSLYATSKKTQVSTSILYTATVKLDQCEYVDGVRAYIHRPA